MLKKMKNWFLRIWNLQQKLNYIKKPSTIELILLFQNKNQLFFQNNLVIPSCKKVEVNGSIRKKIEMK